MVIWGEGVEGTCINRGDEWPRIVGPGVPRVPLGPRHLHGCDGRLWLWIEELASRPRRRRCRTHLRHTRLIPRTHQPAVNELIHQDQETPPVTNPLGATSLPPSDLPSTVITKWSPRAKLEAQLVTHDLWWPLTTNQHKNKGLIEMTTKGLWTSSFSSFEMLSPLE